MGVCTLTGNWAAPDLTARTGKIIATLDDPTRVGSGVVGGSSVATLASGALPTSGVNALQITTPTSGKSLYTIRERLDNVDEQTYRITVLPTDTVIDLSTRPS